MFFDHLVAIAAQKVKNPDNFKNFKETYKSEFLSYDCNQVVQKYLNYQNNSLVKIIWAARAACQNGRLKKSGFSNMFVIQVGGDAISRRATARAPM